MSLLIFSKARNLVTDYYIFRNFCVVSKFDLSSVGQGWKSALNIDTRDQKKIMVLYPDFALVIKEVILSSNVSEDNLDCNSLGYPSVAYKK